MPLKLKAPYYIAVYTRCFRKLKYKGTTRLCGNIFLKVIVFKKLCKGILVHKIINIKLITFNYVLLRL